jgi:hypothetical protein|tara:strand:+ start:602 stop:2428 length:1827 start_codon:yes stop_codon:yes gene_type:complete
MAQISKLEVSELDFDSIKTNLKLFLQDQDEFTDYDFEGSSMSALLDVLSYNTHYNAFYLNMIANEMFLDTAVLRNSVVQKAKELGYTPRSNRGATAVLDLAITPDDSPSTITIAKNTKFNTSIEGTTYTFVATSATTATANSDNSVVNVYGVDIKEGIPLSHRYTVNTANSEQRYTIPNEGVDTTTLAVTIQISDTNDAQYTYTLATDLAETNASSNVYWFHEGDGEKYTVEFGDGVTGRALANNNIVILEYNVCGGPIGNKSSSFTAASTVGGYSDVTISTNSAASGGTTKESVSSIKFNAPKFFTVQNRAVTINDFKRILLADYTNAEAVVAWGGEDNDPPIYGKVYLALKPKSGFQISTAAKNDIIDNILSKYSVASISPEIVDPLYLFLVITSNVNYDSRLTQKTTSQIESNIKDEVITFSTTNLATFDEKFRFSAFTQIIDETDSSIKGNETSIEMQIRVAPNTSLTTSYTVDFKNPISHPFSGYVNAISSTIFTHIDDQGIIQTDCFFDDVDGVIRIVKKPNNVNVVVKSDAGTVNYNNGKIVLNNFGPTSYDGTSLKITVKPNSKDIIPVREQIASIERGDVTIYMQDDAASGTNPAPKTY